MLLLQNRYLQLSDNSEILHDVQTKRKRHDIQPPNTINTTVNITAVAVNDIHDF